jgi:hypothetical protein
MLFPRKFSGRTTAITPERPQPVALILFFVLLGMGALFVLMGNRAIGTRYFESEWEQSGGFNVGPIGIGSSESHGVDQLEGADAELIGIGFVSLGAMMILWGLGGTWSVLRPAKLPLAPSICLGLCILSILLQTITLVCIFPPWKWGSGMGPMVWIGMLIAGTAFGVGEIHGSDILRRRLVKIVLSLFSVVVIFDSIVRPGDRAWVGLILAIFAMVGYLMQVFVLKQLMFKPGEARLPAD